MWYLSSFCRGVASVFNVWLENFSFDFDDSPKYTTLNSILNFVTSEMRSSHGEDLAKKIKFRLDKFQITPYEDEGETFPLLTINNTINLKFPFVVMSLIMQRSTVSSFAQCLIHVLPGSRVGAVVRALALPLMCPRFDSRTWRHEWVESVGSLLYSERYFSGKCGFPLFAKINI